MNQKLGEPAQSSSGQCKLVCHCSQSCKTPFRFFNQHAFPFCPEAETFEPFAILVESLRLTEHIPCSFNTFRSKALVPAWLSRTVGLPTNRKPLWPVPPPLWRWTGNNSPNPKQRRRRRACYAQFLLLQRIVCFLNWVTLGYPDRPPPEAQAGEPWTDAQYEVLETLQEHIAHFCDVPSFDKSDLGRFGEKFGALGKSLQELPQHADVDLSDLLQEISLNFDSYTQFEAPHFKTTDSHAKDHKDCTLSPPDVVVKDIGHKPVVASRIKWKHPPTFDPRPYLLDPVVKAVFNNPNTLRLPPCMWPNKSRARVHCSRPELLKLMKVWDAHGSLALFPCHEVERQETVGIFAVPKDEKFDRLIVNPTVLNSRMLPYSSYTKRLAPGALLALLTLKPGEAFRFCADDLSDFYYTFKVPRARAKRNCIGTKVFPSEVKNLSCFNPSIPGPFYPALATLAMGDGHAVEIAQGAHHSLLQLEAGSMVDSESLEYRKPIPRSNFVELLAIDDHIGVQKLPPKDLSKNPVLRDTVVFDSSQKAYKKVGLVSHPGKARRNQTQGVILGADFDGVKGRVSAPRTRVLLLVWMTALIAKVGTCTRQILSSILGCWVHVVLFRRPLLALIDALFKEGLQYSQTKVFCLSSHARHELMSLCLLGPCAQADLRVCFYPKLFSLDASPFGGAIVSAAATEPLISELWRHAEQRGYHTNLIGPAGAILVEHGIDPCCESEVNRPSPNSSNFQTHKIPPSLSEGVIYDCVEIFRGSGGWSSAHEKQGLIVHEEFKHNYNRLFFKDLADKHIFQEVIALALRRVVREWHAGPPSLSFGTLRKPRLRNVRHPAGFDLHDPVTAAHNLLAMRTAMLGLIVISLGAYFSCEQPGSSVMFQMHLFKVLVQRGCVVTRIAFCNFGSAFKNHLSGFIIKVGCCLSKARASVNGRITILWLRAPSPGPQLSSSTRDVNRMPRLFTADCQKLEKPCQAPLLNIQPASCHAWLRVVLSANLRDHPLFPLQLELYPSNG